MDLASKDSTLTFNQIRLFTAFISLLLSGLSFYFDDLINRDGVMYMEMAQAYLHGGLGAMAQIYDWPFFSLLVAGFSKTLALPVEVTASIINSVLFVIYTDALLLISRFILPNQRQVIIAALLILSFYSVNEYRDYIIRDIGYWAFTSLAFYQLLRFLNDTKLQSALLWQVFGVIALLFRIEGLVLLLALPLYTLVAQPLKTGTKQLLQLNCLLIPMTLIISFTAFSISGWVDAFDKLSSYQIYLNTEALQLKLDERLTILEQKVLSPFSAEYSGLILLSGLFAMLVFKLLEGLSLGYLLLLGLAWWQMRKDAKSLHRGLIVWFVIVNILILMVFVFKQYFVVSRYCIMAVTGLFLLILPVLTNFIEECWQQKRHFLTGITAFLVVAGVIDTFHTTNSKSYIKETAIWASHHLQAEDKLITDDEFIQYYLRRENTDVSVTYQPKGLRHLQKFDYVLLVEKGRSKQPRAFAEVELELVYQQVNRRKNKASVYRVLSDAN